MASPKICLPGQSGSPGLIIDDRLSSRDLVDLLPLQVPMFLLRYGGSLLIVGVVNSSLEEQSSQIPKGPWRSQKPEA